MRKIFLLLFLFISTHHFSFSKEDIYTGIAVVICDCLQKAETTPDNIKDNTAYKTCILQNIKPFKKELKKIVKKSIKQGLSESDSEPDALELFNTQVDAALHKTCPDLSKSIIDSLNLFSE